MYERSNCYMSRSYSRLGMHQSPPEEEVESSKYLKRSTCPASAHPNPDFRRSETPYDLYVPTRKTAPCCAPCDRSMAERKLSPRSMRAMRPCCTQGLRNALKLKRSLGLTPEITRQPFVAPSTTPCWFNPGPKNSRQLPARWAPPYEVQPRAEGCARLAVAGEAPWLSNAKTSRWQNACLTARIKR